MEKDKNYRDYGNRTSFNGRPCRPDQELVPFVLNDEVRKDCINAGLKEDYIESWTIGKNEVPVAFAPVPKGHKADNMKEVFQRHKALHHRQRRRLIRRCIP